MEKEIVLPGDIADSATVIRLKKIPEAKRDDQWTEEFNKALFNALLILSETPTLQGPDGFNYYATCFPAFPAEERGDISYTSVAGLSTRCMTEGLGIVIFNDQSFSGTPFWVLTYGDIFSLIHYGDISGDPRSLDELAADRKNNVTRLESEHLQQEIEMTVGQPADAFFSNEMKYLLRTFFEENGFYNVGVAIAELLDYVPSLHLVFSLSADDLPDENQRNRMLHTLQWYLPRTRPILLNVGIGKDVFMLLDERDFTNTHRLRELGSIPFDDRQSEWYEETYNLLTSSLYTIISMDPVESFDGFNYLSFIIPPKDLENDPYPTYTLDEASDIALAHGVGIMLYSSFNPGSIPLWTFTYGELHSFLTHGTLDGDQFNLILNPQENPVANDVKKEISFEEPSESIIPEMARHILKQYFDSIDMDIKYVLITDPDRSPSRNIVLNVREENLGEEKLAHVISMFQWMLPPGMSVIPDFGIDKKRFCALVS